MNRRILPLIARALVAPVVARVVLVAPVVLVVLVGVIGVAAPPSAAQTLEECIALARQHAPVMKAMDAGVSRADQAIREARAALSPTMTLRASYTQNSEAQRFIVPFAGSGTPTAIKTGSATAVEVATDARYTLYSGGRDGALVEANRAAREKQVRSREQTDADLVLRVSRAYYRALAAGRLEAAARDVVTSAEAHRRTSAARVRAGAAPRLDSLQAHVDLAQRTTALFRSSEAVRLARVELESAIGVSLDPSQPLVEPGLPALDTPNDTTLTQDALRARPNLAALDLAVRETEQRVRAARAARSPFVTLNATAAYLGPNRYEDYWESDLDGVKTYKLFAGVGVTLPILDGGLTGARVGQLEADRATLAAQREDAQLAVRSEVANALSELRVALAVWQSDAGRVDAAREALRVAESGYKGGSATAPDVRDAEASLADARAEEAQSLMDYWTARASLDHATGAAAGKGN